MNIIYIIPKITHGGGMINVLEEVKAIQLTGTICNTTVIALEPGTSSNLIKEAMLIGLKVLISPSPTLLNKLILPADLLVVHYWNCPSMYLFYKHLESSQIKCRICINLKVNGCTLPQVVPNWVYTTADIFIQSNPLTPHDLLPSHAKVLVIPSLVKLPNAPIKPRKKSLSTFKLFHAGTLNAFKMHPQFMDLHAGLSIKDYTLDVWGSGADQSFTDSIKKHANYTFKGFSSQLSDEITSHHLLCNPQTSLSYASYDKIMLESQWLGIPVIVLKNSYISSHIKNNINGIVAENEEDYKHQIEYLALHPEAYKKLAESTYEYAHTQYKLYDFVKQTIGLYKKIISNPAKVINVGTVPNDAFIATIDGMGKWGEMLNQNAVSLSTEEIYYSLRCEGGFIHFYNWFSDNEFLRMMIMKLKNQLEESYP
jgi:glycosyltransferase involved in cell wall biosynthesis